MALPSPRVARASEELAQPPPNFGSQVFAERSASGTLTPNGGSVIGGFHTPPCVATPTGERTPTGLAPPAGAEGVAWEGDRPNCGACGSAFKGGPLVRKHHCRICGRCVCGSCSQSRIMLDGWLGPQRVCAPCVSVAPRAQKVKNRLARVGQQLHTMQDPAACLEDPTTLEDAVVYCEAAVAPLQVVQARATSDVLAATERLQALAGQELSLPDIELLGEALQLLEVSVVSVEARLAEADAELAKERKQREDLEAAMAMAAAKAASASSSSWQRRAPPSYTGEAIGSSSPDTAAATSSAEEKSREKCAQKSCSVM